MKREKQAKVIIEIDGECVCINEKVAIKCIETLNLFSISSSGWWEGDHTVILIVDHNGNLVTNNLPYVSMSTKENLWRKYGFKKNYIKHICALKKKESLGDTDGDSILKISKIKEW